MNIPAFENIDRISRDIDKLLIEFRISVKDLSMVVNQPANSTADHIILESTYQKFVEKVPYRSISTFQKLSSNLGRSARLTVDQLVTEGFDGLRLIINGAPKDFIERLPLFDDYPSLRELYTSAPFRRYPSNLKVLGIYTAPASNIEEHVGYLP